MPAFRTATVALWNAERQIPMIVLTFRALLAHAVQHVSVVRAGALASSEPPFLPLYASSVGRLDSSRAQFGELVTFRKVHVLDAYNPAVQVQEQVRCVRAYHAWLPLSGGQLVILPEYTV